LEKCLGTKAAIGTTFRVLGGWCKARTSFLKRVTGSTFDFILDVLHKKTANSWENHQRSYEKDYFDLKP
jgi:hypothetical protein